MLIPPYVKKFLEDSGIQYVEANDLHEVAAKVDVLYQTRIQKERFPSLEEYEKAKGKYVIDQTVLDVMKKDAIILNSLPRAGEIAPEVDNDPRQLSSSSSKRSVHTDGVDS